MPRPILLRRTRHLRPASGRSSTSKMNTPPQRSETNSGSPGLREAKVRDAAICYQPSKPLPVATSRGDLNNTAAARAIKRPSIDPAFAFCSLEISINDDHEEHRRRYRPFLLDPKVATKDWVSKLELGTVAKMAFEDLERTGERLRILLLYGSLRKR